MIFDGLSVSLAGLRNQMRPFNIHATGSAHAGTGN